MKRLFIVMAVFFSLTLAACGAVGGPTTEIDVAMTDFQFQPNQFIVPAGQEISFNSSNNGAVVHNFVIMKLGRTASGPFDEEDAANVYWEVELVPGGSTETSFTAPEEPGEYQIVCRTEGHIASGMTGTLTVVSAEE